MAENNYCFLNGKIIKEKDARISVNDIGFLRGYGVFDFLRTHKGEPLLLNEHLDRLFNSAKNMGIKIPHTKNELKKIVEKLLKKNRFNESKIRIVVTGGVSEDAFTPGVTPTVLVLAKEFKKPPTKLYKDGVKLITQEYLRENPRAKTLNYKNAIKMREKVEKKNAFGLLYVYQGRVLEGATFNIFVVKGGKILTPKRDIFTGATRNLVIRVASKSFEVEEKDVSTDELFGADEVFITSSSIDVLPAIKIDNKNIGKGKPGKITKKLIKNYTSHLDNQTA